MHLAILTEIKARQPVVPAAEINTAIAHAINPKAAVPQEVKSLIALCKEFFLEHAGRRDCLSLPLDLRLELFESFRLSKSLLDHHFLMLRGSSLVSLNFSGLCISDEGLENLSESLPNLSTLSIAGCLYITLDGIIH
jgi:hypothetical protein